MGFSPGEKHYTTTSIFSNIVDAASGSFTEGLTVSGVAVVGRAPYIQLQDEKSNGTHGGTFTSGAWRTRDLNVIDQDGTGEVTLSSNQFTLPAGTYEVSIRAICIGVQEVRTRLQNITDTATVLYGPSVYMDYQGPGTTPQSSNYPAIGQFTISASKAFEIQQKGTFTRADFGFGSGGGVEGVEIFTQVQLWKLS